MAHVALFWSGCRARSRRSRSGGGGAGAAVVVVAVIVVVVVVMNGGIVRRGRFCRRVRLCLAPGWLRH
jgi:hypothetical protein